MEIIKDYQNSDLNQISQQITILFSYSYQIDENTIRQTSQPALCRDYFGDFIWAEKYNKAKFDQYGMIIDNKKAPLDPNWTSLLLNFPCVDMYNKFKTGIYFLHDIENKNNLPLTTITEVADLTLQVRGDKFWTKSIFNISLYTYLLKVCTFEKNILEVLITTGYREKQYFKQVKNKWEFITNNLQDILNHTDGVSGWENEENRNIGIIHSQSGFTSLSATPYPHNSIAQFLADK